MRNNFAKDHNMINCIVYDFYKVHLNKYSIIFSIYFVWKVSRPLYLSKIFIFKQKLLAKNLGTLTVKGLQLCSFKNLLFMEGVMFPDDRSPIFVNKKKIILNPKDICKEIE